MDLQQFDDLIRSFAAPRRTLLSGLLAIATGSLSVSAGMAKRKHHHKKGKRRAKPNEFGCLEVGDPCQTADQCCSGICDGTKGKLRCQAHGTGTCAQDGSGVCSTPNPEFLKCNNAINCLCYLTTAGSTFCGAQRLADCADCSRDADCEALGFQPGSACVPFSDGLCAGNCASGMICSPPCGSMPPES